MEDALVLDNFHTGIWMGSGENNLVQGNSSLRSEIGIVVKNGSIGASVLDNLASGNSITGIALDFGSASTMVAGNVISHNDFMGMWIHTSTGNSIYHNNFIANSVSYGAQGVDWSLANSWDGDTLRGATTGAIA